MQCRRHDLSHKDDRRTGKAGVDGFGQCSQGTRPATLIGTARMHHHAGRHIGTHAGLQQRFTNRRDAMHAHIDHQRGTAGRQRAPVRFAVAACVCRYESHAMTMRAMRQRDAQRLRRRQAATDAVDHLDFDTVSTQERRLLSAAPKHQRIATLYPRHAAPCQRVRQRLRLDARLADRTTPTALAHRNDFSAGACIASHHFRHQIVDQPYLCVGQCPCRLDRHQIGVTGTYTHQPDLSCMSRIHHHVISQFNGSCPRSAWSC